MRSVSFNSLIKFEEMPMSRIQVRTWILTAAMMVAPAVHAGDVVTDWNQ